MKFLRTVLNIEKEIDILKEQLAMRPDFNILDCFSIFDK
jgi:hypothetical protein